MPRANPSDEPTTGEPTADGHEPRDAAVPPLGPLTSLPGVGPQRAKRLARMGLNDVRDLLLLAPRSMEVWGGRKSIADARACIGEDVTVAGEVLRTSLVRLGGRRTMLKVRVGDGSAEIDAVFFNQPWMRERLEEGLWLELCGRVIDSRGPTLSTPKIGTADKPLPPEGTLNPVYPLTEGISQDLMRSLVRLAVEEHGDAVGEVLPPELLERLELLPLDRALVELHAPSSEEAFQSALRRLRFEPMLAMQARLAAARRAREVQDAPVLVVEDAVHDAVLTSFPFELTAGQKNAVRALREDLARGRPMRRLLQGDVGSGKTVVGIYACLLAARAGHQAAFMAPTELLAEQHFDGLRPWLAELGLNCELLSGSLHARARRDVLLGLASGQIDVLFGTHALFSADVEYRSLALAVIDEQHRFGVDQRAQLMSKGAHVHSLLMTATPIPRTLAMTLYSDLDVSILPERPPGRGKVTTRWLRGPERRKLLGFLAERLGEGEQVYWVAPRIGAMDDPDEEPRPGETGSVERAFAKLRETGLADHGIELVHGRVPPEERARRLERFRRGECRMLVATTVIEVGVDVPQATVMVIEDAERLGLAQLHQLRGRVGRGSADSHCLLLGKSVAAERFETLERTDDGFELAEEDLRRRGMGDLSGLRQAGLNAEGLADLEHDLDLLLAARDLAAEEPDYLSSYFERAAETVRRLTP